MARRFLAIDLGDKRTGLAIADDATRIAAPLAVLEIPFQGDGNRLIKAIEETLEESLAPSDEIVVGVPLNMDGSAGPAAKRAREFANRLAARTGRRVHEVDERLTTADADWSLARSGLTHGQKKARRDAIAAAAILREFLAGSQITEAGAGPDDRS
ncbi:MAG: Holliday junction resolvase RuvX [Phycisphaeraceae bacterium]|nr:Holliday junction resolvase RuvX [Phycisphaeraceae bacterium]